MEQYNRTLLMQIKRKLLLKFPNNVWSMIDIVYYLLVVIGNAPFGRKYDTKTKNYTYYAMSINPINAFFSYGKQKKCIVAYLFNLIYL